MYLRMACRCLCLAMFFGVWTNSCRADFIINGNIQDPAYGVGTIGSLNATMGYRFTVGSSALEVRSLGMVDSLFGTNQQGLFEAHQVGLWNSSGTLLASVTVPAGSAVPLTGDFRYVQLASHVLLNPGQSYTIAALFPTNYATNNNADLMVIVESANIPSVLSPYFTSAVTVSPVSGFNFPTNLAFTPDLWIPANAEFSPVAAPVPSGILLSGVGIACLGFITRLRRTNKVALAS